jgi:hypothetical protein
VPSNTPQSAWWTSGVERHLTSYCWELTARLNSGQPLDRERPMGSRANTPSQHNRIVGLNRLFSCSLVPPRMTPPISRPSGQQSVVLLRLSGKRHRRLELHFVPPCKSKCICNAPGRKPAGHAFVTLFPISSCSFWGNLCACVCAACSHFFF